MATRIKVKRILELLEKDLSSNEIAKTYNISKHSIQTVRIRASALGVSYEKAKEQSERSCTSCSFPTGRIPRTSTIFRTMSTCKRS